MTIMAPYTDGSRHLFREIVTDLIKNQKPSPATGGRKMDLARTEGYFNGWKNGLCDALSAYATQLRIEAWPPFGGEDERYHLVPGIYQSTIRTEFVTTLINEWNLDTWKDKTDEEFWADAWELFMSVVFPEDIRESMTKQHRDNVRRGFTAPTEADRDWIKQELEEASVIVKPYQNLLNKIGGE